MWLARIESQPCGMIRIIKRWKSVAAPRGLGDEALAVTPPLEAEAFATVQAPIPPITPPLTEAQNFKDAPKPGWGALPREKEFTSAQTGKILNVGACFEKLYPIPNQSCFCTLTLPGDTDEANEVLAKYSGWLVNRILQHIRDNFSEFDYFYKWEYQGRGALHLHLCLGFPEISAASEFVKRWKALAYGLLIQLCKLSGIDLFRRIQKERVSYEIYQADAQLVQKSVARYMAKYAAKPEKKAGFKGYSRRIRIYYPSRFSGNSRRLSRMVRDSTYSLEIALSGSYQRKMLEEVLHHVENFCRLAKHFKHEYGDGDTKIFYGEENDRMELLCEIAGIPYDWCTKSRESITRIHQS